MDSKVKSVKESQLISEHQFKIDFLNFVIQKLAHRTPDFKLCSLVYSGNSECWIAVDVQIKDSVFSIVKHMEKETYSVSCSKQGMQSKGLGIDVGHVHELLIKEKNWHI